MVPAGRKVQQNQHPILRLDNRKICKNKKRKDDLMSRENRYKITKQIHPDYIVLIKYKDKYITYNNDTLICNYLKFYKNNKYRFYVFEQKQINYLVLDELDIIRIKQYKENNYNRYVYITNIKRIVKKVGNKLITNQTIQIK